MGPSKARSKKSYNFFDKIALTSLKSAQLCYEGDPFLSGNERDVGPFLNALRPRNRLQR